MQFFVSLVAIPYFTGLLYFLSYFIIFVRTSKSEVTVLLGKDKTMVSRGIASLFFSFFSPSCRSPQRAGKGWGVEDIVGSQGNGDR